MDRLTKIRSCLRESKVKNVVIIKKKKDCSVNGKVCFVFSTLLLR